LLNKIFSNQRRAFLGISLLSFGVFLDYTVVNVALPVIQQTLHSDLDHLQWVMNIYFLALCILATILGRCGDIYGRRRLFYWGSALFAIASIIAGFAPNMICLILGRLLQGVGAALVLPLGPSLLPDAFPEKDRAKAIAYLGSIGGAALALGPVIGGFIVTYWGWRWIFFINIPLVISGFLFCFGSIKESTIATIKPSLDWQGMLWLTLTMSGIVFSLIHAASNGWLNSVTLISLSIGLISSILLFRVERRQPDPLIDFNDFSKLLFYAGAALGFLSGALSSVSLFFNPLYLQLIKHQSPQWAGLTLFAIPAAVILAAFAVGRLIQVFGMINTILIGLGMGLVGTALHAFFNVHSSLIFILLGFICLGVMWAMGNTVSIIASQTAVGISRASVATGTVVTLFNMGGSIGLALGVFIYHIFALRTLAQVNFGQNLIPLITNPTQILHADISNVSHELFNQAFMNGFSASMWFLWGSILLIFLTIIIAKRKEHL